MTLALSAHTAGAQTGVGTIAGTVSDLSGAVVPGASLTLTNRETGAVRTARDVRRGRLSLRGDPARPVHAGRGVDRLQEVVRQTGASGRPVGQGRSGPGGGPGPERGRGQRRGCADYAGKLGRVGREGLPAHPPVAPERPGRQLVVRSDSRGRGRRQCPGERDEGGVAGNHPGRHFPGGPLWRRHRADPTRAGYDPGIPDRDRRLRRPLLPSGDGHACDPKRDQPVPRHRLRNASEQRGWSARAPARGGRGRVDTASGPQRVRSVGRRAPVPGKVVRRARQDVLVRGLRRVDRAQHELRKRPRADGGDVGRGPEQHRRRERAANHYLRSAHDRRQRSPAAFSRKHHSCQPDQCIRQGDAGPDGCSDQQFESAPGTTTTRGSIP